MINIYKINSFKYLITDKTIPIRIKTINVLVNCPSIILDIDVIYKYRLDIRINIESIFIIDSHLSKTFIGLANTDEISNLVVEIKDKLKDEMLQIVPLINIVLYDN